MRRLLMLIPTLFAACGPNAAPPAASAPAAKVTGAVPEAALATLTLTDAATMRLGIETAPVERRRIATTRSLGGEILPVAENRPYCCLAIRPLQCHMLGQAKAFQFALKLGGNILVGMAIADEGGETPSVNFRLCALPLRHRMRPPAIR